MQESLASRLRLLRVQRGLTLQEASDEIGIDRHTLSSIERGTQRPHAPTLKKIAEGYGVAIERLLVQDDLVEEPVEAPTSPKVEAPTSSTQAEDEERREELLGEERGVSEGQLLRNVVESARLAKDYARRWEEESRARITEGDFPWERSMEIQLTAIGLNSLYGEMQSAYEEASDDVNWSFLAELSEGISRMLEVAQRTAEYAAALQARHSEEPSAERASVSETTNRRLRLVRSNAG